MPNVSDKRRRRGGFTLLEVMMAIMILSVMMLLSFFCFDAVIQSWRTGMEVADEMGQADYMMDQLVSGLRSAYYPDVGAQKYEYGFQFSDGGEGPDARDSISWVKIGRALVGEDCDFAESPHRIDVFVSDGGQRDELSGLTIKAWRVDLHLEDFDPAEDVAPMVLSPNVIGLNCRMLDKTQPKKDDEPNWQDEWSYSNCIPKAVELTLYMRPPNEGADPLEIKRIVTIPMYDLSQNPRSKGSGSGNSRTRRTTTTTLPGGRTIGGGGGASAPTP